LRQTSWARACWPCRDKELAAVKLRKEDVEVIVTEYEVERKLAERRLREHGGNLRAALESFLSAP